MFIFWDTVYYIGSGIYVTAQYTILSCILGTILGFLFAIGQINTNKFIKTIINGYTSIIVGTPLMVQLMFAYFAIPRILFIHIDAFWTILLAYSCNSAAYISAHIRGGILAIDKGQFEAAQTLGIPQWRTWLNIIMPQVLKNTTPSILNEFNTLLKETSLVSIVGEVDIMRRAQLVAAETYNYMTPFFIAAVWYYLASTGIQYLTRYINKVMFQKQLECHE